MVRFKNRYIVIEITPKNDDNKPLILKPYTLQHVIQREVQKMFGDFGQAVVKFGFNATYCNAHTRIALIRGRHGAHKLLMKAIPTINDIDNKPVSVKILYVGATIKHCYIYIRDYQQKRIESIWKTLKSDEEKQMIIDLFMTLTPTERESK